jgi:hypothetical protein
VTDIFLHDVDSATDVDDVCFDFLTSDIDTDFGFESGIAFASSELLNRFGKLP